MTLDRTKFEALRGDLLQKRADIDRLVDALNVLLMDDVLMSPRLDLVAEPSPLTPLVLPKTKPVAALRGGPRIATTKKPEPGAEENAKALFMAGMMLKEIAVELGLREHIVYYWSHSRRWRQERDADHKKSSPEPLKGPVTFFLEPTKKASAILPREPESFAPDPPPKQELIPSPIKPIREKRGPVSEPISTRAEDLAQIARADAVLRQEAEAEAAGLTFRCPTCYGRCEKQEGHPECLGREPKDDAVGLVHWNPIGAFGSSRGAFDG